MATLDNPSARLIEDFYRRVWNAWDTEAARALLHPDLTFRGTLGRRTRGIDDFLDYVTEVRTAFPDFHNEILGTAFDGTTAVARLRYTGTHRGPVLGHQATGRRIEYDGLAWFTICDGQIHGAYVLGDVDQLRRQLQGDGPAPL